MFSSTEARYGHCVLFSTNKKSRHTVYPVLFQGDFMKFIQVLCILSTIVTTVVAQEQFFDASQGNIWLGGGVSYSSMGFKFDGVSAEYRLNSLNISPIIRFFPLNGVILGPKIDYARIAESINGKSDGVNLMGIGGEVGYIYGKSTVKPFIFTSPQFSVRLEDDDDGVQDEPLSLIKMQNKNSREDDVVFTLPFTGGLMIPLSDNLGLQLETGMKYKFDADYSTNTFFFGFGVYGLGTKSAVSVMTTLNDVIDLLFGL